MKPRFAKIQPFSIEDYYARLMQKTRLADAQRQLKEKEEGREDVRIVTKTQFGRRLAGLRQYLPSKDQHHYPRGNIDYRA
jgi:hypothetical protein